MKSLKKQDIDKVLGEVFKEYRVKNNLTQEKIAEKLGISVKYISRIENGTGGVKVETLVNYMNILGISPNVIFEKLIIHKDLKTQMKLSKKASELSDEKLDFIISVIDLLENI
ncbi:MAG: helix-turn-helix domain-containing protein [Clostridia bacterium]